MSDPIVLFAKAYASRGWRVFPLLADTGDGKTLKQPAVKWATEATTDLAKIDAWWGAGNPNKYGIAIVAGPGFSILDADPRHNSDATLFELSGGTDDYTNTPTVATPTKGSHFYYLSPEGRDLANWTNIGPNETNGLDLRTDGGGYVVAPPTERHDDPDLRLGEDVVDGVYAWTKLPSKTPMIMLPDWVHKYTRNGEKSTTKGYRDEAWIVPGEWHTKMISIAGDEVRRAHSEEELAAKLIAISETRSHPDHRTHSAEDIDHLMRIAHDAWEQWRAEKSFDQSELGQAYYVVELYGPIIKWNWTTKKWYAFKDGLWYEEDKGGRVRKYVIRAAEKRLGDARERFNAFHSQAEGDSVTAKKKWVLDHDEQGLGSELATAKAMCSANALDHVWEILQTLCGKSSVEFDQDPERIGVKNGVVNLRTGELEKGTPEQMISKHIDLDYHSEGPAPSRWPKFVREIFSKNHEPDAVVEFFQRALGYSLTGYTREQVWFLCYGSGSNGKSTAFQDVLLKHVFGPYGAVANIATFTVPGRGQNRSSITHDLADLEGMRFVNTSEPRGTVELDEERMKSVTTGGRIKADKKFKDAREFSTILKLWVETNHLPRVKDMSDGFWRRVRLLGFLAHFAVPEKMAEGDLPIDIYITRDLAAEAADILWWIVQGAMKYLADGLKTPPEVFDASDEYREDQDDFGQFITECLEFVEGARSKGEELHAAYTRWALKQGQDKPMWIRTFTTVFKERYPATYRRTATERYFDGVKVRKAYEPPPDY